MECSNCPPLLFHKEIVEFGEHITKNCIKISVLTALSNKTDTQPYNQNFLESSINVLPIILI